MALSLEQIGDELRRHAGPSAWQVVETRARSTQRYTVFARDEALREVETRRFHVMVHVRHSHEGKETLGESSFTVGPEADLAGVQTEVDGALARASLVHNETYELPGTEKDPAAVATVDERVVENAPAVADEVVQSIRDTVQEHAGVELSSSEVFANYAQSRILNSRGLDATRAETELMVEYVLLARDRSGDEHEIWQSPRSRMRSALDVKQHIDRYVGYTKDGLEAQLPETGTFDVVFGEEALDTLWDFFVGQASASAKYEGWSRMKPGEPVVPALRGEKLTLTSDPTLPGGMRSQARDAQGQVCKRVTIIDDNVFRAFVASKKYADLTGVPVTGPMGNVVVRTGPRAYGGLVDGGRVYELLRFSTLTPNAISGAFSGEIRTGYVHDGGERRPIKGGSVSGNILTAFQEAFFSSETVQREGYLGPRGVRLAGLTLTGR